MVLGVTTTYMLDRHSKLFSQDGLYDLTSVALHLESEIYCLRLSNVERTLCKVVLQGAYSLPYSWRF